MVFVKLVVASAQSGHPTLQMMGVQMGPAALRRPASVWLGMRALCDSAARASPLPKLRAARHAGSLPTPSRCNILPLRVATLRFIFGRFACILLAVLHTTPVYAQEIAENKAQSRLRRREYYIILDFSVDRSILMRIRNYFDVNTAKVITIKFKVSLGISVAASKWRYSGKVRL